MANNIINYNSRTFTDIRTDLVNYIKTAYPDILSDFTTSSVGSIFLDLVSGVGDSLSALNDKTYQETQLAYAQQESSILNLAISNGLKITGNRPSITLVDITVIVPPLGDHPDPSYLPVLLPGAQFIGGAQTFETLDSVDFSSSISYQGFVNRKIIPNLDANGIIQSYTITKREIAVNGSSNIYKLIITDSQVRPFFQVTLPDLNVLSIDSVILMDGTNITTTPTLADFNNSKYLFYEVDYLAQQRVFVEKNVSGTTELTAGKWINVTKKFIKEYSKLNGGSCILTFGGGDPNNDIIQNYFASNGVTNRQFLDNFLQNTALGEQLQAGKTLFIKYKTGGGTNSNIGANVLTGLGNYTLSVNGPRQDYNQNVQRSLSCTNPISALGGTNGMGSVAQLRQLIKYNSSAQYRATALNDYLLQVYKLPGKYGAPYRAGAFKENNKVVIPILGLNSDGTLSNTSNSLLKQNIAEYLSEYRMVNDYIEIRDGQIFNLGISVDLYVDNNASSELANNVINDIRNYFDIESQNINEDIFIGDLRKEIQNIVGVINVLNIRVYNKVGGIYSMNIVPQPFNDTTTGEIQLINDTVYSAKDSMFEIKYPNSDIKVTLRKKV